MSKERERRSKGIGWGWTRRTWRRIRNARSWVLGLKAKHSLRVRYFVAYYFISKFKIIFYFVQF